MPSSPNRFQLKPKHLLFAGLAIVALSVAALVYSAWRELSRMPAAAQTTVAPASAPQTVEILSPKGASSTVITVGSPILQTTASAADAASDSEETLAEAGENEQSATAPRRNTPSSSSRRDHTAEAQPLRETPLQPINTPQNAAPAPQPAPQATRPERQAQPANSGHKNVMDNLF